jgi:UDP-N-acetylmuramoyl-L-alanyl-D-glutamate--2,6-diaminopimelate ligase
MGGDAPDVEITGLHYSSSDVRPGGLFFCVPGFKADGHDFAPDAVERGAVAIVSERPLGLAVPEVVVRSARAAMGPAARASVEDRTWPRLGDELLGHYEAVLGVADTRRIRAA